VLEERKLKEAEKRTKQHIADGLIKTGKSEHTTFFLRSSDDSIDSAKVLYEISTDPEKQRYHGFTSFNGLLWTVNASYYSIFYMARALLENAGIRIKTNISIHAVTFDAIVSYFYLTGKLQKALLDDFTEAKEDAAEILGKQRADELIEDYFYERKKRSSFTYEMGETLVRSKAKTSLERAQRFRREIRKILSQSSHHL
jgi:hypothetical protein